ncbi:MAG: IS3 family transposase, partial [Dehalococcoidales bacterium]|nr:IS3 family transposase [Dehalococcoidales bacterium]
MSKMRLHYPTALLCRMLRVSASGFYAWTSRPPSEWAKEEMRLEVAIKAAHRRTRQTYGAERLQRELAEDGIIVG